MNKDRVNYQTPNEDEIDLLEIVAKLWKRKWTIILLTALPTLLMIAFAMFKMERVNLYKATTTIDAYQESEKGNTSYINLFKTIVAGEKFLYEIQRKFPKVVLENFQFSFDDPKSPTNYIAISVVSPDQELVEPVANLAPATIQKVLSEDYADIIEQTKQKKALKKESVETYRKNLQLVKSKIEKAKTQEDVNNLLSLISQLNSSLSSIEKTTIFDYSKIKVLDKATRPELSIRDTEKEAKKRKKALEGKWKSKKVIVLVTFFTCFFLSVMLVLLVDFIKNNKDKFKEYLD